METNPFIIFEKSKKDSEPAIIGSTTAVAGVTVIGLVSGAIVKYRKSRYAKVACQENPSIETPLYDDKKSSSSSFDIFDDETTEIQN